MLLDKASSTSIIHLYEHHKIIEQKKKNWSTMVGTFNETSTIELKLKLLALNHTADIITKLHLTDNLLKYDLVLDTDVLHEVGIIFNFKNMTITWQKVSISMKPPNCTANEFFVIKERLFSTYLITFYTNYTYLF